MTVAELIARLQTLPQDALVMVPGYEGDLDELDEVETATVARRPGPNPRRIFGDFERAEDGAPAVILSAY